MGQAASRLDFVVNVAPQLSPDDRALAISLSGNVDRTLEGATVARAAGVDVSVLTNEGGGRLGAPGIERLSLRIADIAPFLCGTSSYTATLAALQMALGDTWPGFAAELTGAMLGLRALPDRADAFAQSVVARLGGTCTGARFLGVGRSVATADYAAAKCVEVTKIPAWADDIEEFVHRQYWAMQTTELVVLLRTDAATAGYADALADLGVVTVALKPKGAALVGITQHQPGPAPASASASAERYRAVCGQPQAYPPVAAGHRTITRRERRCCRARPVTPTARSPAARITRGPAASGLPCIWRWG
jgi:fructoselysine-6-P-deglycase FrlB-like protein